MNKNSKITKSAELMSFVDGHWQLVHQASNYIGKSGSYFVQDLNDLTRIIPVFKSAVETALRVGVIKEDYRTYNLGGLDKIFFNRPGDASRRPVSTLAEKIADGEKRLEVLMTDFKSPTALSSERLEIATRMLKLGNSLMLWRQGKENIND